jgi:hypothetical protein
MDPNEIFEEAEEDYPAKADENEETDDDDDDEEEEDDDGDGEEQLVGAAPVLRRSTRVTRQTTIPNIETTTGTSYGTALNQLDDKPSLEYDLAEAKVIAMIISEFNERMQQQTIQQGHQHITTFSLQKGIEKFGERATNATNKEMQQLIDRTCFVPIKKSELSEIERKRAMESLFFITEKRDGTIKGRHCANGSTQRDYMQREEVTSPTVSTESTLLTAVIEAAEERDVASCDIPNAFVQTELDEKDKDGNRTIMKIRGVLVSILCNLDPSYQDYVVIENNKQVLYVHIQRAIYGMMVSALLFYQKLSKDLLNTDSRSIRMIHVLPTN